MNDGDRFMSRLRVLERDSVALRGFHRALNEMSGYDVTQLESELAAWWPPSVYNDRMDAAAYWLLDHPRRLEAVAEWDKLGAWYARRRINEPFGLWSDEDGERLRERTKQHMESQGFRFIAQDWFIRSLCANYPDTFEDEQDARQTVERMERDGQLTVRTDYPGMAVYLYKLREMGARNVTR